MLSDQELYGVGTIDYKPLCNQIIEIAEDRETAKGFWYAAGMYDELTPSGPCSFWTWGFYAVDFIHEDGQWRIWHLQYLEDVNSPCGSSWGVTAPERDTIPAFVEIGKFQMTEPNVKEKLREYYHGIERLPKLHGFRNLIILLVKHSATGGSNSMNKQVYTDDELIRRVWDEEQIKDMMSRRAMYNANDERRRELDELWVRIPENRKTASYGSNWGYYVGMDEIASWYVVEHDKYRKSQLSEIHERCPEIELSLENQGFGCMSVHPLSSPYVEIAGDGKTGRGHWYAIGQETTLQADGTVKALWINDKIAADFIKEAGQWKIWHLVVSNDMYNEAGTAFAKQPVYTPVGTDPMERAFGTPTIPMLTHDSVFLWSDNYPPILPKAYNIFDPKEGYGPEGHPKCEEVKK